VVRMVDRRDAYRVLVRKPAGKVPRGKPRRRWKGNIRMDFKSVYRTWTGLIWRRIGTGGWLCGHANETSGSNKNLGNILSSRTAVSATRRTAPCS
jgi:hypothetical protein